MTVVCCWQCHLLGYGRSSKQMQAWLELHYERVHGER